MGFFPYYFLRIFFFYVLGIFWGTFGNSELGASGIPEFDGNWVFPGGIWGLGRIQGNLGGFSRGKFPKIVPESLTFSQNS